MVYKLEADIPEHQSVCSSRVHDHASEPHGRASESFKINDVSNFKHRVHNIQTGSSLESIFMIFYIQSV